MVMHACDGIHACDCEISIYIGAQLCMSADYVAGIDYIMSSMNQAKQYQCTF